MIFLAIKSFFTSALAFIAKYWAVLLPILIAIVIFLYISSLRADNASLTAKYNDYVQLNADLATKRKMENALKAEQGKKEVLALTQTHQQEMALILNESKGLKNEGTINKRTIANLRGQLHKQASDYEAARLPGNDSHRFTESDSQPALFRRLQEVEGELMVCREAGAISASDYNFCKSYVDSEQKRLGVEK